MKPELHTEISLHIYGKLVGKIGKLASVHSKYTHSATIPILEFLIILHQCDNSLQQRYNFFMNGQKGGEDFIVWA